MPLAARLANRRPRRIPLARYPLGIELRYRAMLRGIVAEYRRIAMDELERTAPLILAEVNMYAFDDTGPQLRGWAATLRDMILRIAERITTTFVSGLERVAEFSASVDIFNRAEWQKQVRSAYGVDIVRGEPQLASRLQAWEADNIQLIRSIPEQISSQLSGAMNKAFQEGTSLKDLTKIVQERTGVGRARAELIARDQIGRLNGQLAEMRQRNAGIDAYIWRTSQDERVRPTHRVRDGKTFKWSDGGIKPGSEIRCRCNADPVFPNDLTGEVQRI